MKLAEVWFFWIKKCCNGLE